MMRTLTTIFLLTLATLPPALAEDFAVLYSEKFEADVLPSTWFALGSLDNKPLPIERVAGATGSSGAIAMKGRAAMFGLYASHPAFTVTNEMYLCGQVRSSTSQIILCLRKPQSLWYSAPLQPNTWTPFCVPLDRFKLETGDKVVQFTAIHNKRDEITLALDNFAIVRGRKQSRPTAPANLKTETRADGVQTTWSAANDELGVARYRVYRSNVEEFPLDAGHEIGRTSDAAFLDVTMTHPGHWWYKVVAEDYFGNLGPAAGPVSAKVDR